MNKGVILISRCIEDSEKMLFEGIGWNIYNSKSKGTLSKDLKKNQETVVLIYQGLDEKKHVWESCK